MRTHTLQTIAEAHGVNKRAAQNWLAKAKADHGDIGEVRNGTRYFSDSERDTLLGYAGEPRRKVSAAVTAEVVPVTAAETYTGQINGGALVPRRETAIAPRFSVFDEAAATAEMVAIQRDIQAQVSNLDGLFSGYAKARVRKALVEIDHTVEALKANALADMGATAAPKPQGESMPVAS